MPHTRPKEGVWSWKNGTRYYEDVLKWHLSYEMHPEEVYVQGLREVTRIKRKMQKVRNQLSSLCVPNSMSF